MDVGSSSPASVPAGTKRTLNVSEMSVVKSSSETTQVCTTRACSSPSAESWPFGSFCSRNRHVRDPIAGMSIRAVNAAHSTGVAVTVIS